MKRSTGECLCSWQNSIFSMENLPSVYLGYIFAMQVSFTERNSSPNGASKFHCKFVTEIMGRRKTHLYQVISSYELLLMLSIKLKEKSP